MSRRSPRLAPIDSLASPLPAASKAPRKPKLVKNETENSVRQAEFEEAKRKYEQDKQEHTELMAERKRRKTAAWKAEQKAAKKPAAAAAPAATTTLALPGTGGGSASPAQGFEVQRRIDFPAADADPRRLVQQQSSSDGHPFLTAGVSGCLDSRCQARRRALRCA